MSKNRQSVDSQHQLDVRLIGPIVVAAGLTQETQASQTERKRKQPKPGGIGQSGQPPRRQERQGGGMVREAQQYVRRLSDFGGCVERKTPAGLRNYGTDPFFMKAVAT